MDDECINSSSPAAQLLFHSKNVKWGTSGHCANSFAYLASSTLHFHPHKGVWSIPCVVPSLFPFWSWLSVRGRKILYWICQISHTHVNPLHLVVVKNPFISHANFLWNISCSSIGRTNLVYLQGLFTLTWSCLLQNLRVCLPGHLLLHSWWRERLRDGEEGFQCSSVQITIWDMKLFQYKAENIWKKVPEQTWVKSISKLGKLFLTSHAFKGAQGKVLSAWAVHGHIVETYLLCDLQT